MSAKTYYPERLQFRVPAGVSRAVADAAARANSAPHEYLRRVCLAALASEGVALPKAEAPQAAAG